MPMPPPKASTEGRRDRQVFHEMGQIVRALEAQGPGTPDELAARVGAAYWEQDRFDRARRDQRPGVCGRNGCMPRRHRRWRSGWTGRALSR